MEQDILGTSGKEAIPFEYAHEEQAIARKRALYALMQQQALKPQPPLQRFGNYVAHQQPIGQLATALQGFLGARGMGSADAAQLALGQRMQADQTRELQGVQRTAYGTPDTMVPQPQALEGQVTPMIDQAPLPDVKQPGQTADIRGAIAQSLSGRFAGTRAYGADLQKNDRANLLEMSKLIGSADPEAGARFQQGGNSMASVPKLQPLPIESGIDLAGNIYSVARDKTGKAILHYPPKETKVTQTLDARVGPKVDEALDKAHIDNIQASKKVADEAYGTIGTAIKSSEYLDKGADVGGGGSIRQAIRKFSQAWGVDVPETGLTDAMRMTLGKSVMDNARVISPVTDHDIPLLDRLFGSIDTDPGALREINAMMLAKGLITQDKHNALVSSVAATSSGNQAKYDPFKVQRANMESTDPVLLGRAYQLMKENGRDMSGYTFNGKPISEMPPQPSFAGASSMVPRPLPAGRTPAPTSGAIPSVTDAASYAKVPSGSIYVTPDGKTRRKP